jgi:hypothetical protein
LIRRRFSYAATGVSQSSTRLLKGWMLALCQSQIFTAGSLALKATTSALCGLNQEQQANHLFGVVCQYWARHESLGAGTE